MKFSLIKETVYKKASELDGYKVRAADWHDLHGLIVILTKKRRMAICINESTYLFPEIPIRFPLIKWKDVSSFVLVDTRVENENDNVFILNLEGALIRSFYGGDAVQDVEVSQQGIWLSYFDEGIFGSGLSEEGLVLFNVDGKVLFRYHSDLVKRPDIDDCYALTRGQDSSIWLFPYSVFALLELNAQTKELTSHKMPKILHGANAICIRKHFVYTIGNYSSKKRVYGLRIGEKKPILIGELPGTAKGIGPSLFYDFVSFTEDSVLLAKIIKDET